MSEAFIGEIRLMSFVYPPRNWALCDGQLLAISQNQALFSLLGVYFGGDGQTTFALPDLRGRVPIHAAANHPLGERGGEQAHTLTLAEMPTHTHQLVGSNGDADLVLPADNAVAHAAQLYGPPTQLTELAPSTNGVVGGSQPHPNMQPYLTLSFCIALSGIYPSRD